MQKIGYILLVLIGIIVLFFGIKYYLRKKKEADMIVDDDRLIENDEE